MALTYIQLQKEISLDFICLIQKPERLRLVYLIAQGHNKLHLSDPYTWGCFTYIVAAHKHFRHPSTSFKY